MNVSRREVTVVYGGRLSNCLNFPVVFLHNDRTLPVDVCVGASHRSSTEGLRAFSQCIRTLSVGSRGQSMTWDADGWEKEWTRLILLKSPLVNR